MNDLLLHDSVGQWFDFYKGKPQNNRESDKNQTAQAKRQLLLFPWETGSESKSEGNTGLPKKQIMFNIIWRRFYRNSSVSWQQCKVRIFGCRHPVAVWCVVRIGTHLQPSAAAEAMDGQTRLAEPIVETMGKCRAQAPSPPLFPNDACTVHSLLFDHPSERGYNCKLHVKGTCQFSSFCGLFAELTVQGSPLQGSLVSSGPHFEPIGGLRHWMKKFYYALLEDWQGKILNQYADWTTMRSAFCKFSQFAVTLAAERSIWTCHSHGGWRNWNSTW